MGKNGFDLFGFLEKVAKLAEEVGEAADSRVGRSGSGKARREEDLAAGAFEALLRRGFPNIVRGEEQPARREHARKPRPSAAARQALENMLNEVRDVLSPATRPSSREFQGLVRQLDGNLRLLERGRALLLREPGRLPILDLTTAAEYFARIERRLAALPGELRIAVESVRADCMALASTAALQHDEAFRAEFYERTEALLAEKAGSIDRFRRNVTSRCDRLQQELAAFREELARSDAGMALASFDPSRRLIGQFRKGMRLGSPDLAVIRDMLDAEWAAASSEYKQLTLAQVFALARTWETEQMPVAAVEYVLTVLEQQTIFSALRDMGLAQATALQIESTSDSVFLPSNDRLAELSIRSSSKLVLAPDQIDRLTDVMVLAAECALPPLASRSLEKATADVAPVRLSADQGGRRGHYASLMVRLEASALATIGKPSSDRTKQSFRFWHLRLLRNLRAELNTAEPSPALEAWDRYLADRAALRHEVLASASTFWRPTLTALLDSRQSSEPDRDDRLALTPVLTWSAAERKQASSEVRSILERFEDVALGMASEADELTSVEAPSGNFQRRFLRKLDEVLDLSETERTAWFAPPPATPMLGSLGPLFEAQAIDRNHLQRGPFGAALRARDFDAAQAMVDDWLASAPFNLAERLRAFDFADLRITEWKYFARGVADPKHAALGLDLSDHVEIKHSADKVPFEAFGYHRNAFPGGEFGVPLIEAHAFYPYPWQGKFEREVSLELDGLAPLLLALRDHRLEPRGDWPSELVAYHRTVRELAEAKIFLDVNRLIARELAAQSFARSIPIIVGVHDFNHFDPVIHETRSA